MISVFSLDIPQNKKNIDGFNPSTQKLKVNRNVMFDEMVSWYSPLKITEDGKAINGDVSSNVE